VPPLFSHESAVKGADPEKCSFEKVNCYNHLYFILIIVKGDSPAVPFVPFPGMFPLQPS
jgi:hypothetical protein